MSDKHSDHKPIATGENVAFYDLSAAPITFDFIHYIALARMYFAFTTGAPVFRLIILIDRWRNVTPREKSYGMAERQWRLYNLIIPIISMSPFIGSFEILSQRPASLPIDINVFPVGYDLSKPIIPYMPAFLVNLFAKTRILPQFLEVPEQARRVASQMLEEFANPCLVSVRGSGFEPKRNTTSSLLAQSVEYIASQGFDPVVIPDQESVSEFKVATERDFHVFPEASFSLPLRLAIAEKSRISVFSPSGLSGLCSMLRSTPNMMVYGILGEHYLSTEEYYCKQGYNVNSLRGLPWTPENQHWIWNSSQVTVDKALERLMAQVLHSKE